MADRVIKRRNRPNRYPDELLLGAAAEVFHERGFHEASMQEIAERAGATKPTLYARFGSKDVLYDRAMERIANSMIAEMADAYERAQADTPEEATQRCCEAFFDWVKSNQVGFHLLLAADQGAPTGIDHRRRALTALTDLLVDAMTAYLHGLGLRPGPATGLIAAYAVGVFDYGARWAVENDALDRLDIAGFTSTFTLRGLQGLSPDAVSSLLRRRKRAA
jgi:AcrR family transcriptional regulator